MRNKLFRLCAILLVCCVLAGCGAKECEHQWSEADCLNASTCALCGEVQGEALGHIWMEATCESAESCSRCGEKQGEALEHSYGKWMLSSEDMYRVCAVCEDRESREIDYPAYINQEIVGRWNLCYVINKNGFCDASRLPYDRPDAEIIFREDGSIFTCGYEEEDSGEVWVYDHAAFNSAVGQHVINISTSKADGDIVSSSYFSCIDDSITYTITDSNGDTIVLAKSHGEAVAPILTGTWATYSEDGIYSISFNEDRSFTADFDGEISGFWQPRPTATDGGYFNSATILLNYNKDGKEKTVYASLSGFNTEQSQQLQRGDMGLLVYPDDRYMFFNLDSGEALTEALIKADSAILGTWTSVDYVVYSNGEENQGQSTEYSISFFEDGSFSANLHKELSGSWELRSMNVEGAGVKMSYRITAPGTKDVSYFDASADGRGYLYLQGNDESLYYNFKQMTEDEIASQNERIEKAPSMVVGEWFATDGSGVEAAFNEDGSFVLSLGNDEKYEGSWSFASMSDYQGAEYYSYNIETDNETFYTHILGEDFDYSALLSEIPTDVSGGEETLVSEDSENSADAEEVGHVEEYALSLMVKNGEYSLNIQSYLCSCTLTNAEGIARAKEAAESIYGHWAADTATDYDSEKQEGTEIKGDFYIDIADDGSFTGWAGKDVQGTWSFLEMEDGELHYLFMTEGADMGALFELEGEYLRGFFKPYIINFSK